MSLTVTDLFAGAGGSSTGMVTIPGVEVKIAANHWQLACDVHNANHPTAAGMAFPPDYDWHPDKTKPVSNRDMVKMAGNAVTPPSSRDLMAVGAEHLLGSS